ncbi:Ldh family oxidoreductase [Paraburkholderia caballeronis]|uniref:L-lactate dehydrogenase n=1 Tax=Paraburkholderia caballeronis TaxID=416943 RepID=A0A1H7VWX2_9BURK|nr:Ldh family oxidoreductase [Paraburkholderia caballeronis]PXW14632.1 L-lactate dehydrogenase [Paraburkholderia caballeronis]PXW93460.1 L-lactate dehydrogenase [Paraburkholderia caballeronis]RAJ88319.1 L-lactate dehydrogenase [Paraburkholderia caballeronis]TDV04937.1 L-lactate dehydrogenase [Paraburkholderia caballeronis]TDV07984.1 L-lactate dehydrogenase [Paraburkholderia caballeronis]
MEVTIDDARRFAAGALMKLAVPADIADDVAEHLIESDRVGYASHGMSILPHYRRVLTEGYVAFDGRPERIVDNGALIGYDGHNGFGQHVGKVVIEDAIARTQQRGQCIVTLRRSHHLGRMGHYGELVAQHGLVLLAFSNVTNRSPTVAPFGGTEPRLTTNPLCFAGPLPGGRPPFVVDIATSAMAVNKARVLSENNLPAPPGSLIDANGQPTTDPGVLFADPPGALLPFGGHKGYALGLVAELLAGVLSGGGTIQPDNPRHGVATNNLFALVLDPQLDFNQTWRSQEVESFLAYLLNCPPQDPAHPVQYPGEYEAANRARHEKTIELPESVRKPFADLAAELGIAPLAAV